LTWDQLADLDLYVVDPSGETIFYSQQYSSSGGTYSRDMRTGPNAVEFISWGLIQDGIKGPNGNYNVYVRAVMQSVYSVSVLESPDQDWKYFDGVIQSNQKLLIYEFNINSNETSPLISGASANLSGVCAMIYNSDCECGFDIDCNCACELITRSTINLNIYTTTTSTTTTTTTSYRRSTSITTTSCPNSCW
jgi:hypothetical protein